MTGSSTQKDPKKKTRAESQKKGGVVGQARKQHTITARAQKIPTLQGRPEWWVNRALNSGGAWGRQQRENLSGEGKTRGSGGGGGGFMFTTGTMVSN